MNERGVEVLVAAAMRGQKQARGGFYDEQGGMCAGAVLAEALGLTVKYRTGWVKPALEAVEEIYDLHGRFQCPLCKESRVGVKIIVHLNDHHQADFLTIARKLGPSNPD